MNASRIAWAGRKAVAGGAYDVVYTHRPPGGEWSTVTVDAEGKAGYQGIALDAGGGTVRWGWRHDDLGCLVGRQTMLCHGDGGALGEHHPDRVVPGCTLLQGRSVQVSSIASRRRNVCRRRRHHPFGMVLSFISQSRRAARLPS